MKIGRSGSPGIHKTAKWGTKPKILENAEKTAQNAMTDAFIERIKSYAKEDAKRGDYMSAGFIQMERAQMQKYVSPDRSGPMAQVISAIQTALKEPSPLLQLLEKLLDNLSGDCSAKLQISPEGQTAEIRASNGEIIASYNSLGGGWTEIQTKAESKFLSAAAMAYAQAFKEVRTEMKSAQAPVQSVPSDETSVDIRA